METSIQVDLTVLDKGERLTKEFLSLLRKAQKGDCQSAYKLWLDYAKKWARGVVNKWSFCQADKDDLMSEIREKFVQKIGSLVNPLRIRAWSQALAKNMCIDLYRTMRTKKKWEVRLDENDIGSDLAKKNEREEQVKQLYAIIKQEINNLNLPERENNCLYLALEQELNPRKIGEKLGISTAAVYKSIGTALRKVEEAVCVLLRVDSEFAEKAERILGKETIEKFLAGLMV